MVLKIVTGDNFTELVAKTDGKQDGDVDAACLGKYGMGKAIGCNAA